jgi:hypothetical protein
VVFVGGTGAAGGDLYAVPASGGEVVQLTYSGVGEMRPAISPDGGAVAFLRSGSLTDSTPVSVWVMNLLSGTERGVKLPRGTGAPARVGWADEGRSLVIEAGAQLYGAPAPPDASNGSMLPRAGRARAESSLAVLVGRPAFARVMPCQDPRDLCVADDTGAPVLLAAGARDAARWGADSVAYFRGDNLLVRPLGPGRERRVEMRNPPPSPRQATVFSGVEGR